MSGGQTFQLLGSRLISPDDDAEDVDPALRIPQLLLSLPLLLGACTSRVSSILAVLVFTEVSLRS
jgi:hypothetical protein